MDKESEEDEAPTPKVVILPKGVIPSDTMAVVEVMIAIIIVDRALD